MLRFHSRALALYGVALLVAACAAEADPVRADKGQGLADTMTIDAATQDRDVEARTDGSFKEAGGSEAGVTADWGAPDGVAAGDGVSSRDSSAGGTASCVSVLACAEGCADTSCRSACVATGSASAQSRYTTLAACIAQAVAGSCAKDCQDPKAAQCVNCGLIACIRDVDACYSDVVEPGVGELCTDQTPCSNSALQCIYEVDTVVGYCRQTCTAPASRCAGTPMGTAASCISKAGTDRLCSFLCGLAGVKWDCPGALICDTTDSPAGSGQFKCLAPQPQ